jgi:hydroxypyruvate isomerase
MLRFSANLGFLFTQYPLPDAIRAAADAGFDAVECHFPYDTAPANVAAALAQTGLPMLSLNTPPGATRLGEFGLAALPGRQAEARAQIAQAITYAAATGTRAVHVLAGLTQAPEALSVFADNLAFACAMAEADGLTILIEPLNPRDVPGYALHHADQAERIIAALGRDTLRMMFDCYHMQITGGDLLERFIRLRPIIGHVQFAGVPARAEPDTGEVDYGWLLAQMAQAGWDAPFGAEYRPSTTDMTNSLGWLARWRGRGALHRPDSEC